MLIVSRKQHGWTSGTCDTHLAILYVFWKSLEQGRNKENDINFSSASSAFTSFLLEGWGVYSRAPDKFTKNGDRDGPCESREIYVEVSTSQRSYPQSLEIQLGTVISWLVLC